MKKISILILACIATMGVQRAMAWGGRGHHIVAYIAEQHLTPEANAKCREYLQFSLPHYSSWQDYWRHSDPFKEISFWHSSYVNKNYVEKLGFELPEVLTWDFVWEVSEAATKKDADGNFLVNGQKVLLPFLLSLHARPSPLHSSNPLQTSGPQTS